jgi:PST family polysaccharide transporter
MPVNRIAVPLLSRLRPDVPRYRRAYLDMVRIMLLACTPGILFAMMMAHPLMLFLLGPQWEEVAPVFAWLCLGSFASPLYSSTFWLFTTQDRTKQQMFYVGATSAIAVVSFIAGLPWGPAGVAAGAALSFLLISTPLVCWGATKHGAVSSRDVVLALLPLLVAGLATAATLQIVQSYLTIAGPIQLALSALLSYGVFLGVLSCLPFGQPIVRRAWHLGVTLTQSARAAI